MYFSLENLVPLPVFSRLQIENLPYTLLLTQLIVNLVNAWSVALQHILSRTAPKLHFVQGIKLGGDVLIIK